MIRRALATLAAASLLVGLASTQTAQGAAGTTVRGASTPGALAPAYTPAPLVWATCTDPSLTGLQCARLVVPLDYAHPDGTKVTLAVSRRRHSTPTSAGAIVLNPGGPGGSGTFLPVLADYVPGSAAQKYDWVGYDPRGVAASSPALRCDRSYFTPDRPSFVARTARLARYWRVRTRQYASRCASSPARSLLAHTKTADNVQDLESLRVALGLPKISFYGFSYGSYLGQVYATQHPGKVDKMILDGVVDPTRVWYGANLDQDVVFDQNIRRYFTWLSHHPRVFHLGHSAKKIKARYYRKLHALKRHPSARGRLGPDELTDAMVGAGYYVFDWRSTGKALSALLRKNRGAALFDIYRDDNMGDDNGYAMYLATSCTDAAWPGWGRTLSDTRRINRRFPFLTWDNTWYNAPCIGWGAAAGKRLGVSGKALTSKVLLINERFDAATPYSGATRTRSLFPTASLIEGVNGTTHAGSLSGVPCVDNAIARYLATGAVPTRRAGRGPDLRCPRVPAPLSDPGARTAKGGIPDSVRARLLAAQQMGR